MTTDLDRLAAEFFEPVPGMRVFVFAAGGGDTRVSSRWLRVTEPCFAWPGGLDCDDAIDTDDPATVGCLVDQIEALRPDQSVTVVDRLHVLPGEVERRFMVLVWSADCETATTGPTRGAALVAAMRALKGKA